MGGWRSDLTYFYGTQQVLLGLDTRKAFTLVWHELGLGR